MLCCVVFSAMALVDSDMVCYVRLRYDMQWYDVLCHVLLRLRLLWSGLASYALLCVVM